MDNQQEQQEKKRFQGRPTKPDEELLWARKSTPPASHLLDKSKKQIPKKFQAILCLMQDDRSATGRVLSREHLDELPQTKHLPKQEKDLLFAYWPRWQTDVAQMQAIAVLRKEQADVAGKSNKIAELIKRRENFDELSPAEQASLTADLLDQQLQNAGLILAASSVDVVEDELAKALHKDRVAFLKDTAFVRREMEDLSKRHAQRQQALTEEESDEFTTVLISANQILERRTTR